MGLLDDAIREHLELKRRRGADPTEIEREEVEALGPVRRGDVELDDAPEPGLDEDEPAGLEDPGAAYADEPDDEEPPADSHEPDPPAAGYEPEPHDHPVPADRPQTHEAPFAEREEESATPPHGDPWMQQPTREFSSHELEDALSADAPADEAPARPADPDVVPADAEGEDEGDDVLEETPDFLQETPEHDRLWFEQKPPKDFDF
jgi:hypothetical protein